jgi:hypothetical protein
LKTDPAGRRMSHVGISGKGARGTAEKTASLENRYRADQRMVKMARANKQPLILVEQIEPRILVIRGQRVILDADLAELYGTTTKVLNQAVKRNAGRFPADFMLQLTSQEAQAMRSQSVTASGPVEPKRSQIATASKRNIRYRSHAFTEHGALMAASVLNTSRAIDVSVYVIRAFVKLREWLSAHKELAQKLAELECKVASHDGAIQSLVAAIRQLMQPPPSSPPPRQIGSHVK